MTHKCVCESYALAWQFLALLLDITSLVVSGDAKTETGSEGHAWNIIQASNKFYVCDFTWNRTTNTFKYLYCDDITVQDSHFPNPKY